MADTNTDPTSQDLNPKGESRPGSSSSDLIYGYNDYASDIEGGGDRRDVRKTSGTGPDGGDLVETEAHEAPKHIQRDWNEYYLEFPFVQAAFNVFEAEVFEPGWYVEATIDGGVDEDMTAALDLWGQNCAIHAGKRNQDIRKLLYSIPSKRRGKPGVFFEKVGTAESPDSMAALMALDPKTLELYTYKNQNLLVQPNSDVSGAHPTTDDGQAAAYVQYPGLDTDTSKTSVDPVEFTSEDLIKIEYDPPENSPWGRRIWPAIRYHIESLKQKLRDQHASIALAGHPHRIYIGENWNPDQAKALAKADKKGDNSGENTRRNSQSKTFARRRSRRARRRSDRGDSGKVNSKAGQVDYIPGNNGNIEVEVVDAQVADIDDAVMYDIQAIFSILPVSRLKIAFEEDINQFVAEPQMEKDDRYIADERLDIRESIEPLFEEKADELANGSYAGDVEWKLEQPKADNPLERSDFDTEAVADLVGAFADYASSGAETVFGSRLPYQLAGMDPEEFQGMVDASPFPQAEGEEVDGGEEDQ